MGTAVKTHRMVLADNECCLFKAVLNSGLSPQVECVIPKVRASVRIQGHQVMRKKASDPLIKKGLIFVDELFWKAAPDVPSLLGMHDQHITPTVIESDHQTAFFDSDCFDDVCSNCMCSISHSASVLEGGRLLSSLPC